MSDRLTADFVIRSLYQAIGRRRPPPGCIFHSDRGVQYACTDFREVLKHYGFRQSMSKKGDCYDNAVAEKLFSYAKDRACVSAQLFDTSRSTAQYFRIISK